MDSSAKAQLELSETVAKRRWALEQRLLRVSYREIAEELGVSITTVRAWVKQDTAVYLPAEEREELIAQEMANIDRDENRAHEVIKVLINTIKTAERMERLSDVQAAVQELRHWQGEIRQLRLQRTNMMGLNSPVKVQHNLTVRTEYDQEIEALCAELSGGGNLLSKPDMLLVDDALVIDDGS